MISKMAIVAALAAFVLVAGLLYQAAGVRRSAKRFGPPGALIDVDGQALHLVRGGAGEPLVLFEAGVAASSLSWTTVLPGVADVAATCAYDRAGLGWSGPARTPRTVDRIVAELRGVLAHAGNGRPAVLVGHSFGSFLALVYAAWYPGEVAGLVLVDPPTEWQDVTEPRARLLRRGIQASHLGAFLAHIGLVRALLALLTGGAPGVPRHGIRVLGPRAVRTLEHLVGEVRKLPPEIHPTVQAMWCDPKCFRGMAAHLAALAPMGAAARGVTSLDDLHLTVISAGDQQPEIVAAQRELAGLSSRGRHIVAARSGHWIHLDQPDLVVSAIRDVVADVRAHDN